MQENLNKQDGNGIIADVICCGHFEKYAKQFKWMIRYDDNKEQIMLMPHLTVYDDKFNPLKMRVNYCPTCGKEIRAVELTQSQYAHCK